MNNTNVTVKRRYDFYKNGKYMSTLKATKEEVKEYIILLQIESGGVWNARRQGDTTNYKDNYKYCLRRKTWMNISN